jgi:acetyl esterase
VQSKFGQDLEPAIRQFIEQTSADYERHRGDNRNPTPAESRRIAELVREPWRQGGPVMAHTRESQVPTRHGMVRIRTYHPRQDSAPALVYLHGGGWMIFSLDTHDRLMREYAARAGVVVIGVDYALSPEARFPVAHEQCVDVVRWVSAHAAELGVDGDRIVVGGDSAGGNLAIGTALALRDAGAGTGEIVKALVLNYPSFGGDYTEEYHQRFGGPEYMLRSEEVTVFMEQYLSKPTDLYNPLVRILDAELSGLPPIFMAIPECDLLTCQSLEMLPKLKAAGADVRAAFYAGASHSFLEAMSISAVANRALDEEATWLRDILKHDRSEVGLAARSLASS